LLEGVRIVINFKEPDLFNATIVILTGEWVTYFLKGTKPLGREGALGLWE
jgi:hypothetical protein